MTEQFTPKKVPCPLCDGSGIETFEYEEEILDENDEPTGKTRILTDTRACGLCQGTGDIAESELPHYRTGDWEEHPSWGFISVSRARTHPGMHLFDSEIRHEDIVIVQLERAQRRRDHHRDYLMSASGPDSDIVEVTMSMAQWGAFVSSFNTSGVPCTITRLGFEKVELEEHEVGRLELTAQEVVQKARTAVAPIAQALRDVEKAVESNAGKRAVSEALRTLRAHVQSMPGNAKFAADSLTEHAETVVSKARADIEAMVTNHAERLGLTAGETPSARELLP